MGLVCIEVLCCLKAEVVSHLSFRICSFAQTLALISPWCNLKLKCLLLGLLFPSDAHVANPCEKRAALAKVTNIELPPPPLFYKFCPFPPLQEQFPSSQLVNQHKIACTVADHRIGRSLGGAAVRQSWSIDL